MPSVVALRIVIGASLGLGAVDVVWINMALAPEALAPPVRAEAPQAEVRQVHSDAPRVEAKVDVPTALPEPPEPPEPSIVYFATLSAALDDKARAQLEALASRIPADGDVVLEGHADHRGHESMNDRLSRDRAASVARELVRLGIPRDRLRVRHVGEAEAAAQHDGEVWRDRRVDIQITGGTR